MLPYVDPMFAYVGRRNALPHSSDRNSGGGNGVGTGWGRGGERWVVAPKYVRLCWPYLGPCLSYLGPILPLCSPILAAGWPYASLMIAHVGAMLA